MTRLEHATVENMNARREITTLRQQLTEQQAEIERLTKEKEGLEWSKETWAGHYDKCAAYARGLEKQNTTLSAENAEQSRLLAECREVLSEAEGEFYSHGGEKWMISQRIRALLSRLQEAER